MKDKKDSIKRRDIVKGIGAGIGISAIGIGTATASSESGVSFDGDLDEILNRSEIQLALETADVQSTGQVTRTIDLESGTWIEVPIRGGENLYYNLENRAVEIEVDSQSRVKARPVAAIDDEKQEAIADNIHIEDGISIEHLYSSEEITAEALGYLSENDEFSEVLNQRGVVDYNKEGATASTDVIQGVTRLILPLESGNDRGGLFVELDEEYNLEQIYGTELTTYDDPPPGFWDCWLDCIEWGIVCSAPCNACANFPNQATCGTCGACIGGTAVVCAGSCGWQAWW